MKRRIYPLLMSVLMATSMVSPVFADFNPYVEITNVNGESSVDELGLRSVVTVNGNTLSKLDVVNIGDQVSFDIIFRAGNNAFLKEFVDELPEGLKFETNSEFSYRVYIVNNDGSIGKDITNEGKSVINGRVFKWTPNEASKYFYGGKFGTRNRILFRIQTLVENSVKPDTLLTNKATVTFKDPNDESKTPPDPISDNASVKIPATPKQPKITKSVYNEDEKGYIPARLPSGNIVDDNYKGGEISSDMANELFKNEVSKFIVEADKYGIDTSKLSEYMFSFNDKTTNKEKVKIIDEFKKLLVIYSEKIASEKLRVNENTDFDTDIFSKQNMVSDNIKIETLESKYSYVINLDIPALSVKESLSISDTVEHVQSLSKENIVVFDDSGANITSKGEIKIDSVGYNNFLVTWTASKEYVDYIAKSNTDKKIQMRITGVTIKDARSDDLEKYRLGGIVTIPNTSMVDYDGFNKISNKTLVRSPEPRRYDNHEITKGVVLQDGKMVFADFSCNNALYKFMYLYDKIDDFKNNLSKFVEKSSLNDKDKSDLKILLNKLNSSSSKTDRENILTEFAKKDKNVEFNTGSNEIHLPKYEDYYTYIINTSIHPEKVRESIVISDDLADVQKIEKENVRVYNSSGIDVTSEFLIDVKDNKLKASANKSIVDDVKKSKFNVKYQIQIYNVSLDSDDNIRNKYVVGKSDNGDGTKFSIPNTSKLIIDGEETVSNKTTVTASINKIVIPNKPNPNDPNKDRPNKPNGDNPNKPNPNDPIVSTEIYNPRPIDPLSPNNEPVKHIDSDYRVYVERDGVRYYSDDEVDEDDFVRPKENSPSIIESSNQIVRGIINRDIKDIKTGLGNITGNKIFMLISLVLGVSIVGLVTYIMYKKRRFVSDDEEDEEEEI